MKHNVMRDIGLRGADTETDTGDLYSNGGGGNYRDYGVYEPNYPPGCSGNECYQECRPTWILGVTAAVFAFRYLLPYLVDS